MRSFLLRISVLIASLGTLQATGQTPFSTMSFVDINNIKASMLVHGDMWWDPATQLSQCFYPATSTKNVSFAAALWMSGYDGGGQLHISSQMYRQNGNDYWPGPLDASDTLTYATATDWARIWKVNRTQIDTFLGLSTHTVANTPLPIMEWPGKGNIYAVGNAGTVLNVTEDMAPFVDVNSNGVYEPLLGDYPKISGDQALWCVFSDNGPTHTESKGKPLGVEIHTMAYAYKRGTLVDNIIFYEYTINNKSSNTYNNFRIGQFADMDLGNYLDDYIGFDSAHRMGFVYNGAASDATYGTSIPIAGVAMIVLPGDATGSYVPAGSFAYFNNDTMAVAGNPGIDTEYNNYLRSKTRLGNAFTNDYVGAGTPTVGYGSGPLTNYVFPGVPSNTAQWSECSSGNTPGDRRFVITSNDFTLSPGATQKVVMALVTTTPGPNACGGSGMNLDGLHQVADTAWNLFFNPIAPINVNSIGKNAAVSMYPNPVTNQLMFAFKDADLAGLQVTVYNAMGRTETTKSIINSTGAAIDVSALPVGVYYLKYSTSAISGTLPFVKQ